MKASRDSILSDMIEAEFEEKKELGGVFAEIKKGKHGRRGVRVLEKALAEMMEMPKEEDALFPKLIDVDKTLRIFALKFPGLLPILERRRELAREMLPSENWDFYLEMADRNIDAQIVLMEIGDVEVDGEKVSIQGIEDRGELESRVEEWDFTLAFGIPTCLIKFPEHLEEKGWDLVGVAKRYEEQSDRQWQKHLREQEEEDRKARVSSLISKRSGPLKRDETKAGVEESDSVVIEGSPKTTPSHIPDKTKALERENEGEGVADDMSGKVKKGARKRERPDPPYDPTFDPFIKGKE